MWKCSPCSLGRKCIWKLIPAARPRSSNPVADGVRSARRQAALISADAASISATVIARWSDMDGAQRYGRAATLHAMVNGMIAALEQARRAAARDEVPIGAVVVRGDQIVAEAHNETVARRNPTYHAEFLAIERALEALET